MANSAKRFEALKLGPASVKRSPVVRHLRAHGESVASAAFAQKASALAASHRRPTLCRCLIEPPLLESRQNGVLEIVRPFALDVRSNSPAASTKAAATSSRAVLLVSRLTNLVLPWSSLRTLATAKLAANRDREHLATANGPSLVLDAAPECRKTLLTIEKHVGSPGKAHQHRAARQAGNDHK